MARTLTFRSDGKTFRTTPVKIDRRKLYGWTGVVACDDEGGPCTVVSTDETGTLVIPKGGTASGLLSSDGRWVERDELHPVRSDGLPVETLPSSFSGVIELGREAGNEAFLDHVIVDFYELRDADEALIRKADGRIFMFDYCYNDGCFGDPAFVMTAGNRLFLLVGRRQRFEWIAYEAPGYLDEDASDEDYDDTFDFAMFSTP